MDRRERRGPMNRRERRGKVNRGKRRGAVNRRKKRGTINQRKTYRGNRRTTRKIINVISATSGSIWWAAPGYSQRNRRQSDIICHIRESSNP